MVSIRWRLVVRRPLQSRVLPWRASLRKGINYIGLLGLSYVKQLKRLVSEWSIFTLQMSVPVEQNMLELKHFQLFSYILQGNSGSAR